MVEGILSSSQAMNISMRLVNVAMYIAAGPLQLYLWLKEGSEHPKAITLESKYSNTVMAETAEMRKELHPTADFRAILIKLFYLPNYTEQGASVSSPRLLV